MTAKKEYCCPVGAAMDEIGGKWKPLILWTLKDGKLRFSEINRILVTVTQRMLTKQLRELEKDNLINRKVYAVYAEVPPKVEYSLTKKGESVLPILHALHDWGKEYCVSKICLNELNEKSISHLKCV
ncbi:winged helix-turn-helix transcriptional regulator [Methanobacterium paludis]|uniref:Transcriptional regulator, HxlR family n=1 Tax=Methanobacterium paludis (strain DSM 25820 / JCM 18151 / SWAN1) TaxID=868131 RepID=F6D5P8_METPW|nr:helix-turn-helix domain-containing protein [Methanobacterium paludis]AEG18230.1 transcriptional regulator, HxlR family [Methanobacterium paludis]